MTLPWIYRASLTKAGCSWTGFTSGRCWDSGSEECWSGQWSYGPRSISREWVLNKQNSESDCRPGERNECLTFEFQASLEVVCCFINATFIRKRCNCIMHRRLCPAYHIERSIATRLGLSHYPCACTRCRGARIKKVEVIARHHLRHGRDRYLIYPVMTVDGRNVHGPMRHPDGEEEMYRPRRRACEEGEFTWQRRTTVDVENMARDAFGRVDDIHHDVFNDDGQTCQEDLDAEDDAEQNEENLEYLIGESTQQVFEGSTQNRLQCAIVLFSLCTLYSVPHTFIDALLTWIAGDLLPTSNCFLRTFYELKSMLMKLGLQHKQVHCCPNGHVLYEGDNKDLSECPTCQQPRFIPRSNGVPQRVVRYFDFVKHFLRMFKCPEVANHLTWYDTHKCRGQKMRSVADSLQWKTIDELYPDFVEVKTNLRLGLVADGIIPYRNNAIKHSTWVFLLTIYNLPPWLLTKKFFISLAVLIPGPKGTTAENVDVFLGPVIPDLLKLWRGISAVNMSQPEEQRVFTLRAMLIWTVNDFPAYGLLSGQQVHGYKGCPLCGPETCSEYAHLLHKMIYLGGRRHLASDHPFRRARVAFNNHQEWHVAPARPTGEEVCRWGSQRDEFLRQGGVENSDSDPVRLHGVKRRSIFFELPYWKFLPVRHVLDVMHCEKNLSKNILRTAFGEKDYPAVRADMEARNIRPHLHLQEVGPNHNRLYMPDATYVLSTEDKAKVLRVLKSLRTPTHYVGALHTKISKGKLSGLKSHDFHILLQQILPLCFRRIGNKAFAGAVIRLSRVFQKLCAKTIDGEDRDQLTADCAETMCILEKELPPSFFDMMAHLPNHLVEEVFLCGPVHTRWMYPFERYFKTLKGFVRNLAKPEGSIAQGYQVEQAVGFITEYMSKYSITTRRVWDDKEEPTMVDEILEGKGKSRELSEDLRNAMHDFVLDNSIHLESYRERYDVISAERETARAEFQSTQRRRNGRRWVAYPNDLEEVPPFSVWIKKEIEDAKEKGIVIPEDVEDSSKPPSLQARRFRSMYAYGFHLRVKSAEENLNRTCDSGVAAVFRRPCRSGRHDQNPVHAAIEYIGQIVEIVELDYGRHCTVLLVCEWVKANYRGRNATVKKDEWGFTMANFTSLVPFGYESFAFPINCDQVFFSDDEDEPGWKVVLRTEVRGRRIDNEMEEEEESEIFRMGENNAFEGLSVASVIPESDPDPLPTGRDVEMNEILGEHIGESSLLFDRDVGESSEEDN